MIKEGMGGREREIEKWGREGGNREWRDRGESVKEGKREEKSDRNEGKRNISYHLLKATMFGNFQTELHHNSDIVPRYKYGRYYLL